MLKTMIYPLLSCRELQHYTNLVQAHLPLRVDRVFVPFTTEHPDGYFKNEWVFELSGTQKSFQLFFSVRSQNCGWGLFPSKTFSPARAATHSGFDLTLKKNLVGGKLLKIEAIENERWMRFDFFQVKAFQLFLGLIPNQAEAVLLGGHSGEPIEAATKPNKKFSVPLARELTSSQLEKIPFRKEWVESENTYTSLLLSARKNSAFILRKQKLVQSLSAQKLTFEKKRTSIQEQWTQSQNEPDWNYYGSLLQVHFHAVPVPKQDHYELQDYEKGILVSIPADPKLNLKQQLGKYFHLAKRNRTRIVEAGGRISELDEKIRQVGLKLERLNKIEDLSGILEFEQSIGLGTGSGANSTLADPSNQKQKRLGKFSGDFSGKQFTSREGLSIICGRNATENIELTFKIAKGNDLWFHVKGRPGSHTVVLLPPKKTASLETLLDAATLCILYSGGREWGKTEVDYTQRKFVKKIKNQTEVSYTQNKTLIVAVEAERLKRLSNED